MKDVLYSFKIQKDLEENKVLLFNFEENIISIVEATFITSMTHSVLQPAFISTPVALSSKPQCRKVSKQ